jgi:outer membrane protein assembly factor BamB
VNPTQTDASALRQPLRLWPGVVIVLLQWLTWYVLPSVVPQAMAVAMIGMMAGGLAILVWWLFFSRAPWSERLGAVAVIAAALFATPPILHKSISGAGGVFFCILAGPGLCLALVVWAGGSRRLSAGPRWASMVAAILVACGVWALVRTGGVTGGFRNDFAWRWSESPEERLVAQAGDVPHESARGGTAALAAAETGADWPGFRGSGRDSIVHGVRIATDWAASPPVEVWRRPIGPAWSSFAVHGDLLYTQEQRGEEEIVSCYRVTTGEPVWMHHDATRFWETASGAGPRGTPMLANGRVYTLGATGILNALDARDGAVIWSRNAATDTGAKLPDWGFSGSPVVIDDLVIVATAGKLVAYDLATGNPRWFGPARGGGYSSPHLATIDGVTQVLMRSGTGATSFAPADGTVLWQHDWPGTAIVQPALTSDSNVLLCNNDMAGGEGMRRLAIAHGSGGWTAVERWTSKGLKPFFNDFVVHKGHAFGFDGNILSCIDLEGGERKWKGGRFGNGQLLLLADQDLLLVVSEGGELALVSATPDQFTELARFPAIRGKTWNHPALVGDILLVRNDQEMAAFRLALARP